jgi:phenylacetate-CoA ligase
VKLTPLDPWITGKIDQDGRQVSRTALEAYQLRKLRETLRLARAKSAFYREHLAAAPEELATLADLCDLPFTTAEDIREHPLKFVCVSQGEIQRVVTLFSSGTTGQPKRLYFTADDQELTLDFFHVGMSTLVGSGDRVLILLPAETPGGVGDLLATALERLGAIGVRHGPVRDVAQTLAVMSRERVNSLVGIPTQVLALARYRDANGLRAPWKLKSLLLTTDYVPPAIVAAVEEAWGCQLYNHYGMTETGLGGGVECQARRGYHMREADLYFEIIDPETGQPLPEGEEGEVVFTTLTRRGMPLIRYRTGDLSRFLPEPCPCGTALRTLARVRDRLAGRIPLGNDLALSMADLDDALFPLDGVLDFRATLSRDEQVSRLHLDVQVMPGAGQESLPRIEQALESIPAIRRARALGHLALHVRLWPRSHSLTSQIGKRTIIDRRDRGL